MTERLHRSQLSQRDWRRSRRAVCALLLGLLLSVPAAGQRKQVRSGSTVRIYLARHGQTDWNLEGRTQGGKDIPLNAAGRQQAQQLRARLTGVQLDAIYSSTLRRSRETAEIVHGEAALTNLPGLCERRFGKFEGLLTSKTESGSELERRQWSPDDSLDGGESLNAFRERVRATMETLRKQHPSGSILIVGHSYTNRMILSVIFGLTIEQMRSINQANDELYLIELESGSSPHLWKLITEANLPDL